MNVLGIIPARFASSRFPGKPLVKLGDKTMIQRVYEKANEVIKDVFVATDHPDILKEVQQFGGRVIMTNEHHRSGTDRLAEALEKITNNSSEIYDIIINIQGDEPFLHSDQIQSLIHCFNDKTTQIGTLVKRIEQNVEIFNPNMPKVVFNKQMYARYFSRSPIPHVRGKKEEDWMKHSPFYRHIGLYGYRTEVLKQITKLPPSGLELAENLEQLRWLENGYRIKVAETTHNSIGIDTPEDLELIRQKGLIP